MLHQQHNLSNLVTRIAVPDLTLPAGIKLNLRFLLLQLFSALRLSGWTLPPNPRPVQAVRLFSWWRNRSPIAMQGTTRLKT